MPKRGVYYYLSTAPLYFEQKERTRLSLQAQKEGTTVQ